MPYYFKSHFLCDAKDGTKFYPDLQQKARCNNMRNTTSAPLNSTTKVTLFTVGHPVFNQVIPDDRVESSCLFSQLVPLQLVAKIPGKNIPVVLWDNEVISYGITGCEVFKGGIQN